jgi:XTP/dITP diphosphohydrolase
MNLVSNRIYIASYNQHKIDEIKEILGSTWDVGNPDELNPQISWEETGTTFAENAIIKIRAMEAFTEDFILADDSGLCVDALAQSPGVYSSRFAGVDATDGDNIAKLLADLRPFPKERRAEFICCLAFFDKKKTIHLFEGRLKGKIADRIIGVGGFGYDPIFIPDGFDKTLAELSPKEKNSISHRRKALDLLHAFLQTNLTN